MRFTAPLATGILPLTFCLLVWGCPSLGMSQSIEGMWDAAIDCPGGEIRFGLDLQHKQESGWSGFIVNGPERIKIPSVTVTDKQLSLKIDHYDSTLDFDLPTSQEKSAGLNARLKGTWKKRRGHDEWVTMKCEAQPRPTPTKSIDSAEPFLGRWAVKFKSSKDPAVGIFKSVDGSNQVLGTFLTTTGDYRFLDGSVVDGQLQLSCFDGAHAFLFKAKLDDGGKMVGDFWSSNTWHETWTASLDAEAQLPDGFKQTSATADSSLGVLSFPDLQGKPTRLDDPKFSGKARIIYVFGSWCPNCHDAGKYFSALEKKYGDQGLSILGLAFELTGDFERDAAQVQKYLDRHDSKYPVLIAGLADKAKASEALPILDRVRSYPTTLFLNPDGTIKAIHTGFSGPATGDAYIKLQQRFESLIEEMLQED